MSSQKGPIAGPIDAKILAPLPNADKYSQIVTRFAPNPDFVLHVGSLRAVFLSHDYARMYKGKFILRFEDTDPRLQKSVLEHYGQIEEDVKWRGCRWGDGYVMRDRVPLYCDYSGSVLQ